MKITTSIYKNKYKSNFAKSVAMIVGGTVFTQVINTLLTPIISRIYTPEEYGILTVYTALLTMIGFLGALCYDSSIPIADDDEKAVNAIFLCVIILLVLTFFLILLLLFFEDIPLDLFNGENLVRYKYLIPLGFLATGLYTILSKWAFRKQKFDVIATTKYCQSIMGNAIKITLGLLLAGPMGLVLGKILGQSSGIVTLAKLLLKEEKKLLKTVNIKYIVWCAKRYIRFPLYSAPGVFVNNLGSQIPIVFISGMYSAETVGFYGLAKGIAFLPMTIIGQSVQDVFYGEAASVGRSNPARLKEISNMLLRKLILLGSIPMIILIFFGPFLFSLVFGDNWYEAGVYSRLIVIYVFSFFIFQPISVLFMIFEQQSKSFIIDSVKLGLVLLLFWIANKYTLSSYVTIFMYAIVLAVIELARYVIARKIIDKEIKKARKEQGD